MQKTSLNIPAFVALAREHPRFRRQSQILKNWADGTYLPRLGVLFEIVDHAEVRIETIFQMEYNHGKNDSRRGPRGKQEVEKD